MKRLIALVCVIFAGVCVAQVQPPPQEEPPFKIVIEDVPETNAVATVAGEVVKPAAQVGAGVVEGEPDADQVAVGAEKAEADPVPNCAHALSVPAGYSTEVLMLQIFLDRHNFSCGVIDGVWGGGSRDAMRAWQLANGRRATQWVDVPLYADIATMPEPITRHTITAEDAALVSGPLPPTWAERARMELMGYESLGACLAERFHTSERTLRRLNPGIVNWPGDLAVGMTLNVPNVRQAALRRPAALVIALEDCVLAGYDEAGVMALRFPCSIARRKAKLPEVGEVTVRNMAPAPNYTYDPVSYGQDPSVGKMVVPAGPRNPVGSRWIGLSLPGYGIHGSPRPNTVGRPESMGCFRLTNWNAEKLFELVRVGMPVRILWALPQTFKAAPAAKAAEQPKAEADKPAVEAGKQPATEAAKQPAPEAKPAAEAAKEPAEKRPEVAPAQKDAKAEAAKETPKETNDEPVKEAGSHA